MCVCVSTYVYEAKIRHDVVAYINTVFYYKSFIITAL